MLWKERQKWTMSGVNPSSHYASTSETVSTHIKTCSHAQSVRTRCFSPPEHFVHQGPKAPEHEPRQIMSSSNIGTNKDAISCTECFSPPEHFVHQGPKAPEHEPRQIVSSSLCTRKDQRWHKQRRNFMHRVLQSS